MAFITTVLARRAQFHQFSLVENLTPFDHSYMKAKERFSEMLSMKGLYAVTPYRIIYGELQRQTAYCGGSQQGKPTNPIQPLGNSV